MRWKVQRVAREAKDFNRQQAQLWDEHHEHWTATGVELDALNKLYCAIQLLETARKTLEEPARKEGALRYLGSALGLALRADIELMKRLSMRQRRTLQIGFENVWITVTPQQAAEYTNVHNDDLRQLVAAARGGWCQFHCTLKGKETRRCELRQALNQIPGLKEARKTSGDRCPYVSVDLDESILDEIEGIELEAP